MNRLALLLIIATLGLGACGGNRSSKNGGAQTVQSNSVSIAAVFSPDPPKQGPEAITIMLKERNGNPLRGAAVTIAPSMPKMTMTAPTLTARDKGDGTYVSQTNLNYATQWVFSVTAISNGKTTTARFSKQVK